MNEEPDILKRFPHGVLFFDGTCGACSHFVGGKEKFYNHHGFAVAAAQDQWAAERLARDNMHGGNEIRLLLADGSYRLGADAYREICSRIWWLKPVWIGSRMPVLSSIFNLCYRAFASNRHRISRTCGLQSRARYQ